MKGSAAAAEAVCGSASAEGTAAGEEAALEVTNCHAAAAGAHVLSSSVGLKEYNVHDGVDWRILLLLHAHDTSRPTCAAGRHLSISTMLGWLHHAAQPAQAPQHLKHPHLTPARLHSLRSPHAAVTATLYGVAAHCSQHKLPTILCILYILT